VLSDTHQPQIFRTRANCRNIITAKYRDVQQELIAEIQRSSKWPAVVSVDGNIGIPEETHFIDRDDSFLC
jgi:hypothetical protein